MKKLLTIGLMAALSGCVAQASDEPLGEALQASGEAACGSDAISSSDDTNGKQISYTAITDAATGLTEHAYTSPNGSYTNTGCSSQYIVEVTNVSGKSFDFEIDGALSSFESTQSGCTSSLSRLTLTQYTSTGGSYTERGTLVYKPTWFPFFGGGWCYWGVDAGVSDPAIHVAGNEGYTKVRAVGQYLYFHSPFHYEPVTVGVVHDGGVN